MRDRAPDELRPVTVTRNYTSATPGSVLIQVGETWVLCTATATDDVPRWMRDSGRGWVTAEYAMLPGAGADRIHRNAWQGGRSKEISRLIGRSLRAVTNLGAMGELSVRVDCDVLQADGGTRTAAITGAWVALHDALAAAVADGLVPSVPLLDRVAATSVGIVEGQRLLDLEYASDAAAEVDMNVVMTGRGLLVEVQGTAEEQPYTRRDLDGLLDLAEAGIGEMLAMQAELTGFGG